MAFAEYSRVRVRQLSRPQDAYDAWHCNQRPPRVGDIGIVVDTFASPERPDNMRYVVECSEQVTPGGAPMWLSDFSKEELEAVHV